MDRIEEVQSNKIRQINYRVENNTMVLYFFVLVFTALLFLRDVGDFNVNKFLFVIITCIAVITLKLENVIYLFCFANPLCVGLPSKYMIILFILPFVFNHEKLKFRAGLLLFTVLASLCIFMQNIFFNAVNMESMIFPVELVFVMLLFAYKGDVSAKRMSFFFIFGVAILGIIMLLSELRYFSFAELLDAGNRLGTKKDEYFEMAEMRVSVDPNYYGMFAITALVLGSMAIKNVKTASLERIMIITALGAIIVVAFIGLSRSFLLVASLYVILFLFKQKKAKSVLIVFGVVTLLFLLISALIPDVMQTLFDRFTKEDSLQGANGRGDLLSLHFKAWYSNVLTILFGTGLMECNVHCMPLQYLFGGGMLLFILMFLFFLSLYNRVNVKSKRKGDSLIAILPLLIMSCTIPIATSLTQLFTIVLVIYCSNKGMI